MIASKKVQVVNGTTPSADRFVSMTTARLLATDLFVVGVVDGTGRLADHTTLLTTPNYERARKHANRLVQKAGGRVEPTHYTAHLPHSGRGHGYIGRGRPVVEVEAPLRTRYGRYTVRWRRETGVKRMGKKFDTEREAIAFHAELVKEMAR